MKEILVAIIGAVATIVAAVITARFTKQAATQPEPTLSDEDKKALNAKRKIAILKVSIAVAFLIGLIFTFALLALQSKIRTDKAVGKISSRFDSLALQGIKNENGNPYFMPAIYMDVDIERVKDSVGKDRIVACYTIAYDVVYLKSVGNQRAFDDYFRANRNGEVVKLNGSDKEVMTATSANSKAWNVEFPTEPGENRMVVSKFNVIYPPVIGSYASRFFGTLGPNEEEFSYPNSAEDAIGELLIMVSSSSLALKLAEIHNAAIGSLKDLNPARWVEPTLTTSAVGGKTLTTIAARFKNIGNNDVAKLKVSW